jgi:hypothetical protein
MARTIIAQHAGLGLVSTAKITQAVAVLQEAYASAMADYDAATDEIDSVQAIATAESYHHALRLLTACECPPD